MPTGMLNPDLENAAFDQNQDTIFDRLNAAEKSWKVYYYDIPCSLILTHQRRSENLSRYCKIEEFFDRDAQGAEADFPEFVFIEPKYFGIDQNDDHPPHNVIKSEKLIADVYNALRSNPDLWPHTLLVVLFDEHGGFYDHVEPPLTVAPDDHVDKIFERRFTTKAQGTGLGLHFCKTLFRGWGGDIRCESEEPDFTRFVITLPEPKNEQESSK